MSSQNTFPYVYRCIHRITGEMYIGMRCAKKGKKRSPETAAKIIATKQRKKNQAV